LVFLPQQFTEFDPKKGHMTFTYPPKRMKTAAHGIENLTITGVTSPSTLERELCMEDGSGPARLPNGNAFKTLHIIRNGEELGYLFELRSTFYQQYLASNADEGPRKALEAELGLPPHTATGKPSARSSGRSRAAAAPVVDDEDGGDEGEGYKPAARSRRRSRAAAAVAEDEDEGYHDKPKRKRAPASPRKPRKKRA
jgi:hypothetical protein